MNTPTRALGSLESSEQLIRDLYLDLRQKISVWASVTKQTAQARMGYVGQHLVSVVTGYPGGRSGARGKDLVLPDGQFAEIKTCYRVDQLGKCNSCGAGVSALELECYNCNSSDIKRNDDSKWLIGIQHDKEFSEILDPKFYYLVLFDFTDLARPDTIRASIWRVDPLAPGFAFCLIDYYRNIKSASKSGAPFNLWPYSLKFELMRPLLIYQALVLPDNTIDTRLFPSKHQPKLYPLSHLRDHAASRNLTADKILDLAERLGLNLPSSTKKHLLLDAAQEQISVRQLGSDKVVDAFARAFYGKEVSQHLRGLPDRMKSQLRTAGLM